MALKQVIFLPMPRIANTGAFTPPRRRIPGLEWATARLRQLWGRAISLPDPGDDGAPDEPAPEFYRFPPL